MKKKIILLSITLVAFILASCVSAQDSQAPSLDLNEESVDAASSDGAELALAQCLTDSGAKFYGAHWCPHCNDQKAMFASAVKEVPYIECTQEQATCSAAGITGYPTWIFADGTVAQGAQPLEVLAQLSGCEY